MMTAEELAAVVNAEMEGEEIESAWLVHSKKKEWKKKQHAGWYIEDCVYRIKPKPKTKKVYLNICEFAGVYVISDHHESRDMAIAKGIDVPGYVDTVEVTREIKR